MGTNYENNLINIVLIHLRKFVTMVECYLHIIRMLLICLGIVVIVIDVSGANSSRIIRFTTCSDISPFEARVVKGGVSKLTVTQQG